MLLQRAFGSEAFDTARIFTLIIERNYILIQDAGLNGQMAKHLEGFLVTVSIPTQMCTLVGSQMLGEISCLSEAATADVTRVRSLPCIRYIFYQRK